MMDAKSQVAKLISTFGSLLERSDFVYGEYDDMQSKATREFTQRMMRLDNLIVEFKDSPWNLEYLSVQDFSSPRSEIADKIVGIIGSSQQLTPFVDNIWLTKYPFITALLHADLLRKVKWPRGKSPAVSYSHNNKEIDLVGVVLFLTKVQGFKQKAVFQFIATHGNRPGLDRGGIDSGQLSSAADAIKKTFESLRPEWDNLNFAEGSLQSEVRDALKKEK
ncbi:TPA: hypothetical protein ACF92H_005192 [Klebsiella pneumoniae]|nr:hypothetical protein [Klebsiella pneumoniae]HBV1801632.1 hypothetical protein [Klebsiella pneumoniae]HCD4328626.1 hypothetical protein [Klebsiella pneumoniae]